MRNRRFVLAVGAMLLLALAIRHPSADIRVMTHDVGDRTPHQVSAAIDLGLVAFSILYTWTGKQLSAR